MKNEKAVMSMRSVNANPGKYVSIITNFGCHYTCPECIVRNNGLKMSETDKQIRNPNKCKHFEFNPVDVLDENKKYRPREPKKKNIEGQVSFL